MRHRRTTLKLGRTASHRDAMLRNLVTDFFRHEKVRTTQANAKALRPYAEKLITLGKRESLHARRQAARLIRDKSVVKKLFDDVAPRYAERPGGYTRIIKLPQRAGDNADMALIELVEAEMKPAKKKRKKKGGPRTAAQDTAKAVAAAEAEEIETAEPEAEEVPEADEATEATEAETSPEVDDTDEEKTTDE